jgi:hypothetical protein
MKHTVLILVTVMATFFMLDAEAARTTSVRGYTNKKGVYVHSHRKTTPNSTKRDNYSTKGNVNPYTGKAGTKSPDRKK